MLESHELGVVAFHLTRHDNGEYDTVFELFLYGEERKWFIYRRYVDFQLLHTRLCTCFAFVEIYLKLPPLFQLDFTISKETRYKHRALRLQADLNAYIHRLLEHQQISSSTVFQEFCQEGSFDAPPSPTESNLSTSYSCSTWEEESLLTKRTSESLIGYKPDLFFFTTTLPPSISCNSPVHYGQPMQWTACAGLTLRLLKPHRLSGRCVSIHHDHAPGYETFVIESATALSSADRVVEYGDICHIRSLRQQYLAVTRSGHVVLSRWKHSSMFRVLCPRGGSGPLNWDGDFCLQEVQPEGVRWIGMHKDCLAVSDGIAPVLITTRLPSMRRLISKGVPPQPLTIRALTYNVWFLPQIATSFLNLSPYKPQRARAIPSVIPSNIDVVVFTEAFDDGAKLILTMEMKRRGFIYETRTAGCKNKLKLFNSGVFAMSKYPLDNYDEILYGSVAIADERFADKGSIYVQMQKDGQVVHVFGTHTQAWDHDAAIACRAKQIQMLSAWIKSKKIPADEAVIFAGDFNIDMYVKNEYDEFGKLLAALGAAIPDSIEGSPKYSFDPFANPFASGGMSSGGKLERLDYVMYGLHHRLPRQSWTKVMPVTASVGWHDKKGNQFVDLSDHYPVISEFHF